MENYVPILTEDKNIIISKNTILLQSQSTGKVVYFPLNDQLRTMFNVETNVNSTPDETDNPRSLNIMEVVDREDGDAEETQEEEQVESDSKDTKLWTNENVLFFIDKRIEVNDIYENTSNKKGVWCKLATECSKQMGRAVTKEQLESKWKSLVRTYKSIVAHNATKGKGRRTWAFFSVMHDFMKTRPEITSVATCSSSSGLRTAETLQQNAEIEGEQVQDDSSSSTDRNKCQWESSFQRKRRLKKSEATKRHEAKMARFDRFNDLMERMLEKM